MKCYWCRKEAGKGLLICEDCDNKPKHCSGYSMAKKLEMADRIKGIDKLETQNAKR